MNDTTAIEATYGHWWYPRQALPCPPRRVARPRQPHCGTWYPVTAPIPVTARWALVHSRERRIRYATSQAAAIRMQEEIALADHPHVSLVPVCRDDTRALRAFLQRQGLGTEEAP
jgi:hypothetical protein